MNYWLAIQHDWPTLTALALGILHLKAGTRRAIAKHANQVNQVIQWALAQQPPSGGDSGDGTKP